jgi:hypothetical protein
VGFIRSRRVDGRARNHRALARPALDARDVGRGIWFTRRCVRQLDPDLAWLPVQSVPRVLHHVSGELDFLLQRDPGIRVRETQHLEVIPYRNFDGLRKMLRGDTRKSPGSQDPGYSTRSIVDGCCSPPLLEAGMCPAHRATTGSSFPVQEAIRSVHDL